jgi:hypothetical protein
LLNLQRIQRGKGHCKPWEERRVNFILDNLHKAEVRFCPGVLNPADLPSRGCDLIDLLEKKDFWIHGPEFLIQEKDKWPKQPVQESNQNKIQNDHQ